MMKVTVCSLSRMRTKCTRTYIIDLIIIRFDALALSLCPLKLRCHFFLSFTLTMFYYISFLRPPPLQVLPSSQVTIIPQIANDLRTESLEDSQVIFYSWLPASNSTFLDATKPVELTTWRQTNAYKEITVPSPPGLRDGQSWRLILSSMPQRYSIHLEDVSGAESYLGKTPFPVISMPIKFTRNANQNRAKQEKIERYYSFTVPNAQNFPTSRVDLALRITEQTSFDLDKVSLLFSFSVFMLIVLKDS